MSELGSVGLILVAEAFALNLAQVWMMRKAGFLAAVLMRVAFYAVFRVIYGGFFW